MRPPARWQGANTAPGEEISPAPRPPAPPRPPSSPAAAAARRGWMGRSAPGSPDRRAPAPALRDTRGAKFPFPRLSRSSVTSCRRRRGEARRPRPRPRPRPRSGAGRGAAPGAVQGRRALGGPWPRGAALRRGAAEDAAEPGAAAGAGRLPRLVPAGRLLLPEQPQPRWVRCAPGLPSQRGGACSARPDPRRACGADRGGRARACGATERVRSRSDPCRVLKPHRCR